MPAAIILTLVVVFYRVVAATQLSDNPTALGISNFSPMAAIILCAAVFLPWRVALSVAFGSLFISDLILNHHYGVGLDFGFFAKYAAFALIFGAGFWYRKNHSPALLGLFSTMLASAIGFYLITNTASWITSPAYAKTFAGWIQALTTGVPGFPPTWTFFRNSLVGDLLFTGMFVLAMKPELFRSRPAAATVLPASR
jgi:hypothetical protein